MSLTSRRPPGALGDPDRRPAARRGPRTALIIADGLPHRREPQLAALRHRRVALIALPMTLLIVAGEIDLSVASMLGLSSALLGSLWNHNWPIETIIPIGPGGRRAAAAPLNGLLVTRLGLPSLAVTIGTLAALPRAWRSCPRRPGGHRLPRAVPQPRASARFAGTEIPNPLVLFVVLAVIFGVVAAPHAVRALALRDRRQRGGGASSPACASSGIKFWLFVRLRHRSRRSPGSSAPCASAAPATTTAPGSSCRSSPRVLLGGVSIFGGGGPPARRRSSRSSCSARSATR